MNNKHFDFNIIDVNNKSIVVRVSSIEKVNLILLRGKFLPFEESEMYQPLAAAYLDSEHNYKDFSYDYNLSNKTKSGFLIIVKDETNKEQYSIGFNFDDKKINIRPMSFGE